MPIIEKHVFVTSDGTEFDNREEAWGHERAHLEPLRWEFEEELSPFVTSGHDRVDFEDLVEWIEDNHDFARRLVEALG